MFAIGDDQWPGLSKLAEESGEVLQVIGKLMGTNGKAYHWDGTRLRERLIEEVGDVLAACQFVTEVNQLEGVHERAAEKLKLFHQWHKDQTAKQLAEVPPRCTCAPGCVSHQQGCPYWVLPY
jgi:NTP pyrophosphatase (non-canonical NTP hydrolase)